MQSISPSDRALGDLLVARRVLSLPQLDEAVRLAETWHVRLGDAILSRNWAEPGVYYAAIAFHYELPFVDLLREPPDPELLVAADAETYARRLAIPWGRRDGKIVIATADPGPDMLLFARERWGAAIEFVVTSKFDIIWAVQTAFATAMSHRAVHQLAERTPDMSARQVFSMPQVFVAYALMTLLLAGLAETPVTTLVVLNVAMSVFYLGNFLFKTILVSVGGARNVERDETIAIEAR